MKSLTLILLSSILILLPSCAQKRSVPTPPIHNISPHSRKTIKHHPPGTTQQGSVQAKLNAAYREWAGTPHRDGGMSKKGIDCSGFVTTVFKEKFNQKLPRTTTGLAQTGRKIPKQQLKPGDLVLFKIGWGGKHVGIYTGDGHFIHASKSKGVWRSKLSLQYWQDQYWQSRRVLK